MITDMLLLYLLILLTTFAHALAHGKKCIVATCVSTLILSFLP